MIDAAHNEDGTLRHTDARAVAAAGTSVYVSGYDTLPGRGPAFLVERRRADTGAVVWRRLSDPSAGTDVPGYGALVVER